MCFPFLVLEKLKKKNDKKKKKEEEEEEERDGERYCTKLTSGTLLLIFFPSPKEKGLKIDTLIKQKYIYFFSTGD